MGDMHRATEHLDAAAALIRAGYCRGTNAKDAQGKDNYGACTGLGMSPMPRQSRGPDRVHRR
jgi:hypothetical protein